MRAWLNSRRGDGNNNNSSTNAPQDVDIVRGLSRSSSGIGAEQPPQPPLSSSSPSPNMHHRSPPQQINRQSSSSSGGGVLAAMMAGHRSHAAAMADAEMERNVAIAARKLGDGVGKIVLAARMGSGGQWKERLLALLGGGDEDNDTNKAISGSGGKDTMSRFPSSSSMANSTTNRSVNSTTNSDGGGEEIAARDNANDYNFDPSSPFSPMGGSAVDEPIPDACNIDILLENSTCERFVLRCVENELPPNLIHCLRLLRVLELQHDVAYVNQQRQQVVVEEEKEERGNSVDYVRRNGLEEVDGRMKKVILTPGPVSCRVVLKVNTLLCLLCADPSVGEQLRPHLFGLLALSGASYPLSGVHIASAAGNVITAFSSNCLSSSLVWFLHDRKMIVHMTDDIKELCGMTRSPTAGGGDEDSSQAISSASQRCMYGSEAESAGLWVIALRTVVHLVVNSCHFQCVELLKDYDGAGGYHILAYAIARSGPTHVTKLLELVTMLVCCRIASSMSVSSSHEIMEGEGEPGTELTRAVSDDHIVDIAENRVAMNTNAFEIMDDLMIKSIPLFEAYKLEHGGARPTFSGASLPEKTDFAVRYAWKMQRGHFDGTNCDVVGGVGSVDLTSELLVTTLQLYSDHAKNFDLIESEYHMLSHYILAFPTFTDVSVKVLTLKTLEYVCTGLTAGANSLMPLRVVTEVFVSECKFLLRMASSVDDSHSDFVLAALAVTRQDLQMLRDTLVKLLEFDENLHHIMLECGLLGSKIDDILEILVPWLAKCGNDGAAPSVVTLMDPIYVCICSILKLVARQPGARTVLNNFSSSAIIRDSSLTSLLTAGIMHLGDSAAQAALDVFDAIMAKSYDDLLREDMICLLDLVDRFSVAEPILYDGIGGEMTGSTINPQFITRQATVLDMIKGILPTNPLSQELFRKCGGFECLVRIIFRIEGLIHQVDPQDEVTNLGVAKTTMKLLESAFALLMMATDPNSRNLKLLGDLGTPPVAMDYLTDETNVAVQSTLPPSTINLLYLRNYRFYIEFANAIAGVGILLDISSARSVMNLALDLIHPKLALTSEGGATKRLDQNISHENILMIRNADAARLVLGLTLQLPDSDEHKSLAKNTFDELLRLCASDMAGSSLARFAASGLCTSLTSKQEFAFMLEDRSHFLYSRFVLLLRRVAAYSMTYNDFVSLLRCVAGPIILAEQDDDIEEEFASTASQNKRIRLAVVFSSIQNKRSSSATKSELWQFRETGFCNRLETLSVIAERGDRVARCELGGDTLNTIFTYMQTTPLEERLYKLAEQGRLKFLEIESVDSSAKSVGFSPSEAIWNPLVSSGFTFCVWMRQQHPFKDGSPASLFMFDIFSPPIETTSLDGSGSTFTFASSGNEFFSFWYDISNQRFRILTSSSSRGEPTSFPVSPLPAGVWHHIQLSYQAPIKRAILGRRAVVTLHINGRSVESEAKVEAFNLPPNARIHIGVPNPVLASSGIVRGSLPLWDLGPTLLVSSVLSLRDATAMYTAGPEFPGLFWGDRPQRLSLAAAATSAFVLLADNGEKGSVAGALRRRQVPNMEAVGHVVMDERGHSRGGSESDSLSVVNLLCKLPPESIFFAFRASSSSPCQGNSSTKFNFTRRLVNVSRINSNGPISTDAVVYGYSSIISPSCFADNVQWIGGPNMLMPIVNATHSSSSLALSLRIIRESVKSHPPNLEMLQAGGGYRMLALLLRQKRIMDINVLDQCFAFAVHGFVPGIQDKDSPKVNNLKGDNKLATHRWLFADLDAMKYLLLNHQVWDLNGGGPDLPMRLLSCFNGLVVAQSIHAAFNSRRLHLLGVIRWTLHLMLEATELFAEGASATAMAAKTDFSEESMPRILSDVASNRPGVSALAALNNGWFSLPSLVSKVASGRDPENEMLSSCKTLLRRVLTFMLTPGDLEAIAGAAIYTVSITGGVSRESNPDYAQISASAGQEMLAPGAVARVYLLRLLEELVVDGVNEIVTDDTKISTDAESPTESSFVPHSGGGTYLGIPNAVARKKRGNLSSESANHPKHQEAQIFLSAFAGILSPVWFACILEGCREEASASAVLRLMVLMIQNSRKFAHSFEAAGGFAPLVLSIPRYSTCPSIMLPLLSHLLNAPILHLPSFATLDSKQLCDVFDAESDAPGLTNDTQDSRRVKSDPSCGIFALLAECLGRNIQLASFDNELGDKARKTNEAILQLLIHRHAFSASFQLFCQTRDFLEPLAQALCLVHDEKLQKLQRDITNDESTIRRKSSHSDLTNSTCDSERDNFVDWPSDSVRSSTDRSSAGSRRGSLELIDPTATPTERLVGKSGEGEGTGIGMVQLLFLVLSHAVLQGPLAAPLVSALFRSYPIHASPDQVEVFQLVLIEHCRTVVNDALQRGEPIAIANCIGLSSVLLDRLMAGFFTSEGVLAAVNIVMFTLSSLTGKGTYASRLLKNDDQNLLVADAAHIARLTCLTAIHRSRPIEAYEGDDDLKLALLILLSESMRQLLLVSSMSNLGTIRKNSGNASPAPSSRIFPLWQSASLSRCCPAVITCAYPDLSSIEEPDKAFVVALTADLLDMLLDEKKDIREQAVVVVVSLLQRRRGIMSELLITDIPRSDQRMETVDLMNRGGFGTLLVAHEATTIAENVVSSSLQQDQTLFGSNPGKIKYASFFEWLERNQEQVAAVFHGIHIHAMRTSITSNISAVAPDEAIEYEQKNMLLKLTSRHSSDRTILGGLERADLAHRSHDATAESHVLWKRQGFDDLSSGAMQWKILSRQLKGSCTIWEGDFSDTSHFTKSILVSTLLNREVTNEIAFLCPKSLVLSSNDTVKRWKLDLTEGYERQRRRLLPNYEFHGLYNIDEKIDNVQYVDEVGLRAIDDANVKPISDQEQRLSMLDIVTTANSKFLSSIHPVELEVTADLLNKMNLVSTTQGIDEDDDYDYEGMEDELSDTDTTLISTHAVSFDEQSDHPTEIDKIEPISDSVHNKEDGNGLHEQQAGTDEGETERTAASSYDLITGLLKSGDWPEKSYNVSRCTGLEVRKALLIWCRHAIYVIDGFEQTDSDGLKGKIKRLKKATTSYQVSIRQHNSENLEMPEKIKGKDKSVSEASEEEITYQHRSQRIPFSDVYSVYRRRYQLQQNALEFYDVHRNGTLLAFTTNADREEVLSKVLATPLPCSIFSEYSSVLSGSTSLNYKKFMNNLRSKITSQWVQGKITNFDFIMHMNSFAGRTYNDLTQYPVFPWVLADYRSEELDLNDPKIYRDLSKPMGAQGSTRAMQYKERYDSMEQSYQRGDGPPPFHYGTHYSCAAYVLHYLMRLEPFSRLALSLQGGKFDVADRLFHNIGSSWTSASSENIQDVRELIPEFFYLPDFLVNSNMFDFGITQVGKTVHDLTLPPWAKGDTKRFVRLHRQALESDYVSRNLHKWLDLIFGCKQRGKEAVDALNAFVHVTYEGQVDLDSIEDPIERESIIAQIQNFGQTPSRLERKSFPPRVVASVFKEKGVDLSSLSSLSTLTPPFCVVGAPQRVHLRVNTVDTCKVGMSGQSDSSVGDLCLVKGQLVGVGKTCALILPSKKYYRYGEPNNGVSVHVAVTSARYREANKVFSIHDGMHRGPISMAKPSLDGVWLVTGCVDSTVRVWKYNGQNMQLQATLCGHDGGRITSLDISTTFGSIVSGGADGKIIVWDLRTMTFLRQLNHIPSNRCSTHEGFARCFPVKSVSINNKNGNIVTLLHSSIRVFDINGNLVARQSTNDEFDGNEMPTCSISTDCPEWMESGIVAISGHKNGLVRLWGIDYDSELLVLRHTVPERVHSCPITALAISGDKMDTLLIGDVSGKMSACSTIKLDQLNANELTTFLGNLEEDSPRKPTATIGSAKDLFGSLIMQM